MSFPSQRTVAPPLCLPLYIKDLRKEGRKVLMGDRLVGCLQDVETIAQVVCEGTAAE
jgi:hypothetical protein